MNRILIINILAFIFISNLMISCTRDNINDIISLRRFLLDIDCLDVTNKLFNFYIKGYQEKLHINPECRGKYYVSILVKDFLFLVNDLTGELFVYNKKSMIKLNFTLEISYFSKNKLILKKIVNEKNIRKCFTGFSNMEIKKNYVEGINIHEFSYWNMLIIDKFRYYNDLLGEDIDEIIIKVIEPFPEQIKVKKIYLRIFEVFEE